MPLLNFESLSCPEAHEPNAAIDMRKRWLLIQSGFAKELRLHCYSTPIVSHGRICRIHGESLMPPSLLRKPSRGWSIYWRSSLFAYPVPKICIFVACQQRFAFCDLSVGSLTYLRPCCSSIGLAATQNKKLIKSHHGFPGGLSRFAFDDARIAVALLEARGSSSLET